MSNLVTDKELLAICNLSNLKMEFADVAKTRDQQTNEILSNHTIYSLIKNELEGHKKREIIRKKKTFHSYLQIKWYIYLMKEYSKENLGSFFRII